MNVRIATLVKNESDRFLPQLLPIWNELGEIWCQIDGDSDDTDETIALLEAHDAKYVLYGDTMEGKEWQARQHLWDWVSKGAEWVVHMDADHCPMNDFRPYLEGRKRVGFYVYDMWSATHYRQDPWWKPRPWWHAVNVADHQHHNWMWSKRGWHSGHLPLNACDVGPMDPLPRDCGLLHYGYATPELRRDHHKAYMDRQAVLTDMEVFHANTILTPDPPTYPLEWECKWRLEL